MMLSPNDTKGKIEKTLIIYKMHTITQGQEIPRFLVRLVLTGFDTAHHNDQAVKATFPLFHWSSN